ncbi:MAG: phosphodiesterase [Proteobacteria bacterium]|nr:phosphodiesterase [Pseudomonadota bacterium]
MTRILQLSDPHIVPDGQLAYGIVDTAEALATAIRTINRILPLIGPVDLAVVTGDLTDFGTPGEYARFKALMAALPIPYRVIPGNHDRREAMRAAFADEDWMPKSGPISWSINLADFSLIALDTLVEGHHHGILEGASLTMLRNELARRPGKPAIVAIHHPPFNTGIIPMDINNLHNGDELQAILDAHEGETRLVCGHVHRNVTRQFGTSIGMIAPGVSHAVTLDQRVDNPHTLSLEPGGFMLHEWRSGIVSHAVAAHVPPERYPFTGAF